MAVFLKDLCLFTVPFFRENSNLFLTKRTGTVFSCNGRRELLGRHHSGSSLLPASLRESLCQGMAEAVLTAAMWRQALPGANLSARMARISGQIRQESRYPAFPVPPSFYTGAFRKNGIKEKPSPALCRDRAEEGVFGKAGFPVLRDRRGKKTGKVKAQPSPDPSGGHPARLPAPVLQGNRYSNR